jgi:hypothetical protein
LKNTMEKRRREEEGGLFAEDSFKLNKLNLLLLLLLLLSYSKKFFLSLASTLLEYVDITAETIFPLYRTIHWIRTAF